MAPKLSQQDLERLWTDLASDDAGRAYASIWTLVSSPSRAVAFLETRLKPADDEGQRIRKLVSNLGSEMFAVRQAAFKELKSLDLEIEPALRRALAAAPTVEFRRRAEMLLAMPAALVRSREVLRGCRAIHALELARSSEAQQLLQKLAGGPADYRLTQEAKASWQRVTGKLIK